ncbi:MAG: phenylacetate--CoA ligase [Sulfolobaceae archaeon]
MIKEYDQTDPKALKREEIKEIQWFKLRKLIKRAYENIPFYRKVFKSRGITPEDIKSPEDFSKKVPFTTKDDLRNYAYPYGGEFLAVNFEELVGWHMTSGTTGIPTVGAYTKNDMELWADLVGRCLRTAGVTVKDIVVNIYGYGLFTGGIGLHIGIQRIGAKVIPWSVGRTEALIKAIKDFKATVITGTPSYELYIVETIKRLGIDPEKELNLRLAIPGAEPMTVEMLEKIEKGLGLKSRGGGARIIYGLTEAIGPGVAQECPYDNHEWLHIWEDHFYVEIIDPTSGELVGGEEEEGELVLTTLSKDAMPVIRYRTRDITAIRHSDDDIPHSKIKRIKGRIDDVIFFKGVKIYPMAVESVIMRFPVREYQIIVDKIEGKVIIKIEAEEVIDKKRLEEGIMEVAFVKPEIEIVPIGTLPRWEGKSRRVIIRQ